ncbi:hypothetical protein [Nocardia fluminea]|uniref:hypothetical protein n=1 Tax=Nocardia fluminea TaxID=134984 RepID=UPI00365C4D8E
MTGPAEMNRDVAELLVLDAIRSRCAVVLIGHDPVDDYSLYAEEIHNDCAVDDVLLARALRDLADRIDARHDAGEAGEVSNG